MSTADLLRRAATGDQRCWDELFKQFDPLVRSVVRGFRLDADTSADVVQVVWMKLFENTDRIRDPERLGSWLATTARHEALRSIRSQKRSRPSGVLDDTADLTSPAPDERVIDGETMTAALRAFDRLPADSQDLMRLLVASPPLPYREIAEQVGRPVGSIGPTRSRCIEAMKGFMGSSGPGIGAPSPAPLAA